MFIVLRIPVGISGFLYRLPPGGLLSLSVLNTVRSWRKLWVFIHIVQIALNPLIVFALSTEIRQHLRSCFPFNIFHEFLWNGKQACDIYEEWNKGEKAATEFVSSLIYFHHYGSVSILLELFSEELIEQSLMIINMAWTLFFWKTARNRI